jgi:hypothetical protein
MTEGIKHSNIYQALSAFQGENPEIAKSGVFGKQGDSMFFNYSTLNDILVVVRPLTSKHGLSFTWEASGDNKMQCVLYHETYSIERVESGEVNTKEHDGTVVEEKHTCEIEKNVIRSMPVTVERSGEMKKIGASSTYARRYTLSEVLGIASEDDQDVKMEEASRKNTESFTYTTALKNIEKASGKELEKQIVFLNKEINILVQKPKDKNGKVIAPTIGLKKEQYEELLSLAIARQDISVNESEEAPAVEGEPVDVTEKE